VKTTRGGAALLMLSLVAAGCAAHQAQVAAPSGATASTAAMASATGSQVLARRCGGCHATPDPNKMSGTTWDAALERMKRRMQLPAAEWDSLATLAQPAATDSKP